MSTYFSFLGHKLFYENDKCLCSIELPTSVTKVNGTYFEELQTYTLSKSITKLSDYCFSNCENLSKINRMKQIKYIGKGCFINCPKLNKNNLPQIKHNLDKYINQILTQYEKEQLEKWTKLKCVDIVFNSDIDNWSHQTSVFNDRIINKQQLLFLIETTDREKFGYYCNSIIEENYFYRNETDMKTFEFNLKSKNKELKSPLKYKINDLENGGCMLHRNSDEDGYLISLGDIHLCKQHKQDESHTEKIKTHFNYNIKWGNALSGKNIKPHYFNVKRILVIQMK